MADRASRVRSLLAIGAAAVIHVVLGLGVLSEPLFEKYPDLARLLAEGRLSGDLLTDASPAYLLLTALLGPMGLLVVQRIAGGALVIMAAAATPRLTAVPWAPVAAAWATALAVPLLLYEGVMEPDALIALAAFSGLVAIPWRGKRVSWRRSLGAGAALGFAAALRPSGLLLLGAAIVLVWRRHRAPSPILRLARPAAALGLGLVIGLAPGALLSARLGGDARAVMSAGQVVNMGNRPEATGLGASMVFLAKNVERQHAHPDRPDYSHEVYRQLARAAADGPVGPFSAELYWIERSLAWARHDPGAALALGLRKVLFLLGPTSAHDITVVRTHAQQIPGLPAWLLWPLGVAGFVILALRRKLPAELFVLVAVYVVHVLAFYVSSRYRLPLVPLLTTTAVAGAGEMLAMVRSPAGRGVRAAWGLGAVTVALLPMVGTGAGWTASVQDRALAAGALMRQFNNAVTSGDAGLAADRAAAAIAAHPGVLWTRSFRGLDVDHPRFRAAVLKRSAEVANDELGRFLHGWALRGSGRLEAAAELQEDLAATSSFAFAVFDRVWDPHLEAARARARLGHLDRARRALGGVAQPDAAEVLALAALTADAASKQRARARLFAIHDRCSALLALGREAITIGRHAEAIEPLEELNRRLPDTALVLWYLGLAREAVGDSEAAASDLSRARRLFPRYTFTRLP